MTMDGSAPERASAWQEGARFSVTTERRVRLPHSPLLRRRHMPSLRRSLASATLALAALLVAGGGNAASFTYQGRLDEDGDPKAGTVDLRFDAFTLDSGGSPLNAVPVIRDGVLLTDGVFAVEVDFGAAVFTGAPVFVQV